MLTKGLSSLIIFLSFSSSVLAQYSFKKEVEFIQHLNDLKSYDEGLYYTNRLRSSADDLSKRDTLNFWLGKLHYQKKDLSQSIYFYNQVSQGSGALFDQAKFHSSLQLAYLSLYDSANNHLNNYKPSKGIYSALKSFQLASVGLLKRDFDVYHTYADNFKGKYYEFKDYEEDLVGISRMITNRKTKSPFIAGLLSTLVPGTGKMYAGKIGQGAVSLLLSGVFALQTWEAYSKDGVKSPRFILFGGIFSAFYAANIWGSVVTVRMAEIEFNDSVNEAILVNMHVPLRVLFD